MPNKRRILIVKFKNTIKNEELKWFRGAIIQHILKKDNILFHNHMGNNFRYSYPLIQYKRIQQCAAIVCIDYGVEAIGNFFTGYDNIMRIGERNEIMEIDYIRPTVYNIQLWNNTFHYRLNRWLPLNENNYLAFKSISDPDERIALLERILIGNILSFAKGLDIQIEQKLECQIKQIKKQYIIKYKGTGMSAFDLLFSTNISLPAYIGLGKNASTNCGIVTPYHLAESNK